MKYKISRLLKNRIASPTKSPLKKKKPPPGSPKKLVPGVRRKISNVEKNRLEDHDPEPEPDSGYKSPRKYDKDDEVVRKLEEEDDEKIEEMIDDISTNEMFGSSILSMEN